MTQEDKQIIAIFDGLAYLAESIVHSLKDEEDEAYKSARRAQDIFRKAASEASGTLDVRKSKEKKA